jgi:hypothetical protein
MTDPSIASLLTGVRPRIGASLIGTFLAGVSPQMHAFWNIADEQQRGPEMINFTKKHGAARWRLPRRRAARAVAGQPGPPRRALGPEFI